MRIEKIRWVATLLLPLIFLMFDSCKSSDTTIAGNWSYYGSYSGSARSGAFQFTIDDKTYVGLGFGNYGLLNANGDSF